MLKKYEALFVFEGSTKDDTLDKTLERVNAEIERLGGAVESSENLGRKMFARPMKKRDSGVYVTIRFELEPSQVAALHARYRLSEDVFRVQVRARDERYEAARDADRTRRAAHRAARQEAERAETDDFADESAAMPEDKTLDETAENMEAAKE